MSLFRKDIEPQCAYCERGTQFSETQVACVKRGVVDSAYHCSAFRYDPLKRVPPRPVKLEQGKLKQEDFSL